MNTEHQEHLASTENSQWPSCPIIFWGTFGTKSPAERRYVGSISVAAGVAACWVAAVALTLHFHPIPMIRAMSPFIAAALFSYVAWELRIYLLALDELARRIQLEAMAWTYLTGMVLAAWLGALGSFTHTLLHWKLDVGLLVFMPFLYAFLEMVRGGWLYRLSRRY